MKQKLTVSLLFIALFLSTLLYADGIKPVGSGTETVPYEISNLDNLLWLSTSDSVWNDYFIQTADINAAATITWNDSAGFSPIGVTDNRFGGFYDGQGYTIDSLYINRPTSDEIGFFGYAGDSGDEVIQNLGLTNVNITGNEMVGGFIGHAHNSLLTKNCYTTGTVNGAALVGGFAGYLFNGAQSQNCYTTAAVNGMGGDCIGGFAGRGEGNNITQCYSMGAVSTESGDNIGGFIGKCYNDVSECYTYSDVTATGGADIGGFAGKNTNTISNCYTFSDVSRGEGGHWTFGFCGNNAGGTIEYCYAAGTNDNGSDGARAFIGTNDGSVNSNFYDSETYGGVSGIGATAKTTAEMMTQSTFADSSWDFANIWEIIDGDGSNYPSLQAFGEEQMPVFAIPEGSGTENDPYVIVSLENLAWLTQVDSVWNKYFVQATDIDASQTKTWDDSDDNGDGNKYNDPNDLTEEGDNEGFSPIGNANDNRFGGFYDGYGYIIDSLYINRPNGEYVGLFGFAGDTGDETIVNLGVTNVDITGENFVGGMIGLLHNSMMVNNCYSTGQVAGYTRVGGFVGKVDNGASVDSCYSKAEVSGAGSVGGFVGRIEGNAGEIKRCYSEGVVNSTEDNIGGFVGKAYGGASECFSKTDVNASGGENIGGFVGKLTATISNCYTTGDVSRMGGGHWTFGFCGLNDTEGKIEYCYAAGTNDNGSDGARAFIGTNNGSVSANFYDSETYGGVSGVGATAKTTAEMMTQSTFADSSWDFVNIWEIIDGDGSNYPSLQAFGEEAQPPVLNPVSFLVPPHALNTTTLSMTADSAKVDSAEYFFECITDPSHSSGWQISQTYVDTTLEMNAEYAFAVKARDKEGKETVASDTISAFTDLLSDLIYVENEGKFVMEAENASVRANGDFEGWEAPFTRQARWQADTTAGGYAGSGYMTTEEAVSLNASWDSGTELSWVVEISTAGEYFIAVRRNSNGDGASDSAKPGVDGEEKSSSTFWGEVSEFTWVRGPSLGNLTVGKHTIQIRRREDGFMIDRVMIATSLDSLPEDGSTEIGPDETLKPSSVEAEQGDLLITEYDLEQNYPNPFNPTTTINYALPKASQVTITIYNMLGQKVAEILNKKMNAGKHNVKFDASSLSSGIYFYMIQAESFKCTKKMILLK